MFSNTVCVLYVFLVSMYEAFIEVEYLSILQFRLLHVR